MEVGPQFKSQGYRGERSHSHWRKTRKGFKEEVASNRHGQAESTLERVESEQRHGGGEAWDMPVTLWESQKASEETSLRKLWGVTEWMFLFYHGPHSPGGTQGLTIPESWICPDMAT